MITFDNIQIENFLSIGSANVDLGQQGLVLVRGINKDSGVAKSNGAGKSAVFEALIWDLFGKTFRGITGDEVINRNTRKKKECAVALSFSKNGKPFEIVRFRKLRNLGTGLKLFYNDKDISKPTIPETQKELERILGFKYDTLVHSTYFGQALSHFSSLTDAQQKKILDDLLGLSVLPKCLARVRAGLKEISHQEISNSAQVEILEQEIEASRDRIKELKETQKKQMKEQKQEKESLERLLKHKRKKHAEAEKEMLEAKESHWLKEQEFLGEKKKFRLDATKLQNLSAQSVAKLKMLARQKSGIESEKEVLYCKVIDGSCPVDEKRRKTELAEIKKQKAKITNQKAKLDAALEILSQQEKELTKQEKELNKVAMGIQSEEKEVDSLANEVSVTEQKLGQIESETEQQTDIDKLLDKERRRLRTKKGKIESLEENLKKRAKQKKRLEFWEEGFGNAGMKSYMLDDVAEFLNEKVNDFTEFLTDGEIRIAFQTQRRLKSGETRERFAIDIIGQGGKTTYAASSGGEKRRIDVAILLALSELTSRHGNLPSLLILDEVFDSLDDVGIERVVRLLKSQLLNKRDSVFVITHSDVLAQHFDKELLITKEDGISSVQFRDKTLSA